MNNPKSILAIIIIGVVYIASMYFYKPYDSMYHQYEGDAFGYYVYLPAFFIHHDLADLHTTMTAKLSHCLPGTKADSIYHNKYFAGTAILQAPFFLIAHCLAGLLHQQRDGFSMIDMYAVELSCVSYSLLALMLILLILRKRFDDSIVAIVLLITGLATNLYYLVVFQPPFCHPYLLFWYALLIYSTMRFYASFERRFILLIGLACGMIVVTRFNELYVVLIPVLWGIRSRADAEERVGLIRRQAPWFCAAALLMILCIVPQILYWKVSYGHFLYYSYQSEPFNFLHPHIIDGLFSGSNGWLSYTPIMLLALVGIWPVAGRRDAAFAPLVVFLVVHIYVIYSWWCWFYQGSYGSRPMTETYALLSIPLAYSVEWCWQSWPRRLALSGMVIFCIWLVTFQTYQTYLGIFNSELSNWHFNLAIFGKTRPTYEEAIVLDTREFQPTNPIFVKLLGENDFEDAGIEGTDTSVATSGHRSVCVHQNQVCIGYSSLLGAAGAEPGQWIKASINCLAKAPTNHNWHLASLVMAFTQKGKMTKWCTLSLQNKIDNPMHEIWHFPVDKWGRIYFYSLLPRGMTATDTISVYIENKHLGPDIYVDDLKMELYTNK
jgi:hypothetical protein